MQTSSEYTEIFKALVQAQGQFENLPFDKNNPHFKNKYASLAITQEKTRPVLAKNGLGIIQAVESVEANQYRVLTTIIHTSGQWISSELELLILKKDMQGLGSATTYAKRYALQSILGLSGDDDDDGNAASTPQTKRPLKNHAPGGDKPVQKPFDPDAELGDYQPTFGKFKLQKLSAIDPDQLWQYMEYIESQATKQNKPVTGQVKEFMDTATAYLKDYYQPASANAEPEFDQGPDPSWDGL